MLSSFGSLFTIFDEAPLAKKKNIKQKQKPRAALKPVDANAIQAASAAPGKAIKDSLSNDFVGDADHGALTCFTIVGPTTPANDAAIAAAATTTAAQQPPAQAPQPPPPVLETPVRTKPAACPSSSFKSSLQTPSATGRKDEASWARSLASLRAGEVVHAATAAAAAAATRFVAP